MIRASLIVAAIVVCGASSAIAQERATTTMPKRAIIQSTPARAEIPVLRTGTKKARHDTDKAVMNNVRGLVATPAAEPLGQSEYLALTGQAVRPASAGQSAANSLAVPDVQLEYLKLTPREPYSGWGYLQFNEPRHIDTSLGTAMFYTASDPSMAFTRAYVKVKKGEKYLVDIVVSTVKDVTFALSAGKNSVNTGVGAGSHHLLTYVVADKNGEIGIAITPDKAEYTFHSLEITRVK